MADKDLHSALYALTHPYMDVVMLDAIEAGELARLIVDMHAAHERTDNRAQNLSKTWSEGLRNIEAQDRELTNLRHLRAGMEKLLDEWVSNWKMRLDSMGYDPFRT